MKKHYIFSLCLCFLCTTFLSRLPAQEYNNFDLNKYYTPDIVRNALGFGMSINDNFNSHSSSNDTISSNYLRWYFNPTFSRYKDTRKRITTFSVGGTTNGSSQQSNNLYRSRYSDNNALINYNTSFYNKKNNFLTFNASGNYTDNSSDINQKNDAGEIILENYNKSNRWNLRASIGIGKGRIEQVTDARQAVYILDELSKRGKLTKTLSDIEIFNFAQTISKVKNKRFLDARLHRIDEITTVDSFLVKNNYLTSQDAGYFSTLYDFWEYGDLYYRGSGQSFEINITPTVTIDKYTFKTTNNLDENRSTDRTYNADLNLIYRFEKSVGLNWQHSLTTSLALGISDYDTEHQLQTNGIRTNGTFIVNYYLSFYPSTRTSFSINAYHNNSLLFYKNTTISHVVEPDYRANNISSAIRASVNYYFSPQLRLSGNAGLNYTYKSINYNDLKEKYFNPGIGASVNYYFF